MRGARVIPKALKWSLSSPSFIEGWLLLHVSERSGLPGCPHSHLLLKVISCVDPSPCRTRPCCWRSFLMHKMLVHHAVFLHRVWSSLGSSNLVWRYSSIFCLSLVHCHNVKVAKKSSRLSRTSSRSVWTWLLTQPVHWPPSATAADRILLDK